MIAVIVVLAVLATVAWNGFARRRHFQLKCRHPRCQVWPKRRSSTWVSIPVWHGIRVGRSWYR